MSLDKSGFLTFGRVARSIQTHYLNIINFFERRATNAAAESFNAKIKAFRAQFRGVNDRVFFYIDLLNYRLKYKIPQIVTLTLAPPSANQRVTRSRKEKRREFFNFLRFSTQTRGRTGMEVNPLVFETSASTDSAIWACLISQMRCKDTAFF